MTRVRNEPSKKKRTQHEGTKSTYWSKEGFKMITKELETVRSSAWRVGRTDISQMVSKNPYLQRRLKENYPTYNAIKK